MKHKSIFIGIVSFILFTSCIKIGEKPKNKTTTPAQSEADAMSGVAYLNQIRSNPNSYSKEFGVDLSGITPNMALKWNDTLAKVAQAKAQDMATRNYFEHVDPDGNGINIKIVQAGYYLIPSWYSDRSENNFESIEAGSANVQDAIKDLIVDNGTPSLGHRLHLLGQGDFWGNCYDIGIGEVQVSGSSPQYRSCFSFVIAKHNF